MPTTILPGAEALGLPRRESVRYRDFLATFVTGLQIPQKSTGPLEIATCLPHELSLDKIKYWTSVARQEVKPCVALLHCGSGCAHAFCRASL